MFCIYNEIMAQDDTVTLSKTTPHFSFYLCLRLTSPNYAFMRRRLNSKRKVKEYTKHKLTNFTWQHFIHVYLLWIIYVISVLFLLCFRARCLSMPCGHLLGKG